MLVTLGIRLAGIAWAVRGPIEAPELGRTLLMVNFDADIQSVYVSHPAAAARPSLF